MVWRAAPVCSICSSVRLTRLIGLLAAAFRVIAAESACLDACINAAGVIHRASFESTDAADLERVMAINVTGPFLALQQAVALMKQGGRIVNVASAQDRKSTRLNSSHVRISY